MKATSIECFSFQYGRSKFIFTPPVAVFSRKRADGTEATESGHKYICPVYREEFADRRIAYEFAKHA